MYQCQSDEQIPCQLPKIYSSQKSHKDLRNSLKDAWNSTVNTLSQVTTNLSYNYKHSNFNLPNQRQPITLTQQKTAFLLGKQYNYYKRAQFLEAFRNVIWISYRKGKQGEYGDVGWGCMIRVVQMLMAEVMHRHFKDFSMPQILSFFRQKKQQKQSIYFLTKQLTQSVIKKKTLKAKREDIQAEKFQQLFSFEKICKLGSIQKRYTSSLEIFTVLIKILQQSNINLRIDVFNSGYTIQSPKTSKNYKFPALLILSNRISLKDIPQSCFAHFKYMMTHRTFSGLAGGVNAQALYILGYCQQKAIFLDPHFVQDSEQQNHRYFKSTPRGIGLVQLSPSVNFCYYIQNNQDYLEWRKWLVQGIYIHKTSQINQSLIIPLEIEDKQSWESCMKIQKKSFDSFHVLEDDDDDEFQVL